MFNLSETLDTAVRRAAGDLLEYFPEPFEPLVQVADPNFGDFQANGILPYAKRMKKAPRLLAEKLVEKLKQQLGTSIDISVAGPGFINFNLTPTYLLHWLKTYRQRSDFENAGASYLNDQTVVVDFACPNTAKQLHIGHIRSMVIGDVIARILKFFGANVIRDNHIGDWGTQFGLLLWMIKHKQAAIDEADPQALLQVEELYKEAVAVSKADVANLEAARQELVQLQKGDAENFAIWEMINRISYRSYAAIYKDLNITFDHVLGESFYRDKVQQVCDELLQCGVAERDNGALVVFHREHPRFKEQPFLILKSDGASNYATTDLATVLYRSQEWRADECIYVTDGRQQDHFQQLFLTSEKWFKATQRNLPTLRHVWFGAILGEDGKAIKTRSGESVKLADVLNEAVERAYRIVDTKNPSLTEEEKQRAAKVIGYGAVKYADLSQCRTSDYVFAWDKLLALDGNTAPYLLYAVARIHSIFRKTNRSDEVLATPPETATEIALAKKLAAFPTTLVYTLRELYPHILCTYLYELAGVFSSFYNADKVLVDEPTIKARRLLLCERTLSVLETGLSLLGIETLDKM